MQEVEILLQERRDWKKYAERTTNYALGVAGDIGLREYEGYREH